MNKFFFKYKNQIIIVNLLFIIISPFLFTRSGYVDFTKTGNIGDTIGGITAPFINILNAFLIYLTFKEQQKANNSLQTELENSKNIEKQRLSNIRKLVIYDLEFIIKPELEKLKSEIQKYILIVNPNKISLVSIYVDLNDNRFKSNSFLDYGQIFIKNAEDLNLLFKIYNRISFIYNQSPSQLSIKYPTDANSKIFINLKKKKKTLIIQNNLNKKIIDLKKLTNLINSVISNINQLIADYK
jgi:hypothetical protein